MQVGGWRLAPPAPPRVRLFATSDLHVTLSFFGSVQEPDARRAWALIASFSSFRRVTGSFRGVQPLGNPRKPSALSAIVDAGWEPLSEMIAEARGPLLEAAGVPPDPRPPLPHMTIGRVQRRASAQERRAALRWAQSIDLHAASFTVAGVALYTWSDDREERLFRIVEQHDFAS